MIIPDKYNEKAVTKIGKNAFLECTRITHIDIPNSVTIIGSNAFGNCTGLTEIFIPKSIQSIELSSGNSPFTNCTNIAKIEFEDGTVTIPQYIFTYARLKQNVNIIIPSSVTKIGINAFLECTGITHIDIPNSVTTIDSRAFCNCSNLTEVNFRGSEKQWELISIGNGNDPLTSATKYFNS